MKNRIIGTIYGQVIGDALGARYEFRSSNRAINKINKDKYKNNNFLDILGGGTFNVVPGQVTDDSELALGLLYSILENKCYDKNKVAKKYKSWVISGPFDIGRTTKNAFLSAHNYNDICKQSIKQNMDSLSNGCLMRICPLAVLGVKLTNMQLLQHIKEDCSMTNPNPIAIDAVKVFCMAIKTLLLGGNKFDAYRIALSVAQTELVKKILLGAQRSPFGAPLLGNRAKECTTHDDICKGYLGIALRNAFYELLHGKSFYDSMVNTVARGGDADTNGCITGALLGAHYGITQIPQRWIATVNMNNPRARKYPEVDQTKLPKITSMFANMIAS